MVYLTGDTHGEFNRIVGFCKKYKTTKDDILIILGDVGLNYFMSYKDSIRKKKVSERCNVTLFCIHGNHEQRPEVLRSYVEKEWHGGIVYYETLYPNILFAKDGEIYDFDVEVSQDEEDEAESAVVNGSVSNGATKSNITTKKAIVIGGAYSVDKDYRIINGYQWFENEQPSDEIKKRVEEKLEAVNWKVDYVLTHTVPIEYEPREVFLKGIDQSKVDKTTEMWLGGIEYKLDYEKWYAGHYHVDKNCGKLQIMFESYKLLGE